MLGELEDFNTVPLYVDLQVNLGSTGIYELHMGKLESDRPISGGAKQTIDTVSG